MRAVHHRGQGKHLISALGIRVLRAALTPETLPAVLSLLTHAQRQRVERIGLTNRRGGRAVAYALQNWCLAQELGEVPADADFAIGAHGKPALPGAGLHFNLAHTQGCAVFISSRLSAVGIDVEARARRVVWSRLSAHALSPAERHLGKDLDESAQQDYWLQLWTLKEAWLKGLGLGIGGGLAATEFSLRGPCIRGRRPELEDDHGWRFGSRLDIGHWISWAAQDAETPPVWQELRFSADCGELLPRP